MTRKATPTRPASAVWLRRWRREWAERTGQPMPQSLLAAALVGFGYRCSVRTVQRWEREGPPAWVRRVLDGDGR